ncbi:MAG: bifunctional UDP-N-acetylglucosamine diphosphorylase/glucosamine-1-phosphate N-acetyltransferase GlmU, partial [Burkholderiales bacterium]|nr:bifunctional UDP-N-acetylglucosamine diphosphorylase/glucosamine-1-phosphate N-acetyltransferase GlmU [Burkholderiales bacterium]
MLPGPRQGQFARGRVPRQRRARAQRGTLAHPHGRDVFIDVGCVFEGEVHLADGVRIGPHCVIRDARIGAGTALDAYTHV